MASNAPGPSTQSVPQLGPRVTQESGAPPFAIGECILVRIPEPIEVENFVEADATIVGSNLPPVSRGGGPQRLAFICDIRVHDESFILDVYPVLSFSRSGGAVVAYNNMRNPISKASLLPLPSFSSRHPTPHTFGQPLTFGNWTTLNDSFLHIFPRQFTMPPHRSFKRFEPPLSMPLNLQARVKRYRAYLSTADPETLAVQSHHPPPNGGSGEGPPHDQIGHGGGQATSGGLSVTSSPTIIGDGDGDGGKSAEEGLAEVFEDVDEDAEDGDATMLDDLRLLAASHPMWEDELKQLSKRSRREKMDSERTRSKIGPLAGRRGC
ncbi:uncharacterized protein LACBIDRAFT_318891 [Laccaria bicolor S238N-H82]|uniref:Predicted protein n=1 Tax=Laccaria bicolor (strain S238N-H82 / ATCC MYA-4686) TaxID=486041 RepID=B0D7C8_LACBS|nr:uncharacterized protein LACBIDRAFT_318891 [Laccaria bicolor S238N-H82]EDR09629.1 predicted protein [Laccaria bicolor S238N-H82]|eukprot:XP_001879978.1 predicted protein [Laccaria bicolor S238N-H82]